MIRTKELLDAGQYYGVQQFFTRVIDYGFSKSQAEAIEKWGGQENVLRDVTYAVGKFRPNVIIARFTGTQQDGHGNPSYQEP